VFIDDIYVYFVELDYDINFELCFSSIAPNHGAMVSPKKRKMKKSKQRGNEI